MVRPIFCIFYQCIYILAMCVIFFAVRLWKINHYVHLSNTVHMHTSFVESHLSSFVMSLTFTCLVEISLSADVQ